MKRPWLIAALLLCSLPLRAQTIDKKFLALNGAMAVAGTTDILLTQSCISAHTCHEGNPFAPSTMRGQAIDLSVQVAGTFVTSYYLKRAGFKYWWALPAIGTGGHIYGAATASQYVFHWRFVW